MKLNEQKFHQVRFKRGLSMRMLARLAKVKGETLYAAFKKDRSVRWDTLLKICDALECSPEDISDVRPTLQINGNNGQAAELGE